MSTYHEDLMRVVTKQHQWVKHTITPVDVLVGTDGEPVVFVDPDAQTISEDNAAYGCDRCGVAMVNNMNTECKGEDE